MQRAHSIVVKAMRAAAEENDLLELPDDDQKLLRLMFQNYRDGAGMRLSATGLLYIKGVFRTYEFTIPEGFQITPLALLWLERETTLPYYLSPRNITVLDSVLAVRLKLANGDLFSLISV